MESVDAHKQLYESKKKAVEAVQKKDRAKKKLKKVLGKVDESKQSAETSSEADTVFKAEGTQELHAKGKEFSEVENSF